MKKLLLLATFSFFLSTFSFSQDYGWVDLSQNIPNQNATLLTDIHFIDENEGWVSTSSLAEIYHTTDGGQTFETQTVQMPAYQIHMLDKNRGYAGGSSGTVFYTNNGGENWRLLNEFFPPTVRGLTFPAKSDTGFICGDSGWVGKIDSTHIFDMQKLVNSHLYDVSFLTKNDGDVAGGSIIRHYNGEEWLAEKQYAYGYYSTVFLLDSLNGWVAGDGGIILHTSNGINYFPQRAYGDGITLHELFAYNASLVWAVGAHHILSSTNAGTDWHVDSTSIRSKATLTCVQFTNEKLGYVCGGRQIEGSLYYEPAFYKYTQLAPTTQHTIYQDEEIKLYPNPATRQFKIQSLKFKVQSATVAVFTITGKKCLSKYVPAGSSEVEVDISSLNSGVYFCKIQFEDGCVTEKVVVKK